jgi:hypothetical protein
MHYRTTPHPSIGVSPYLLVFKTNSPTFLPKHEQIDQKEGAIIDNDKLTDAKAKNTKKNIVIRI